MCLEMHYVISAGEKGKKQSVGFMIFLFFKVRFVSEKRPSRTLEIFYQTNLTGFYWPRAMPEGGLARQFF